MGVSMTLAACFCAPYSVSYSTFSKCHTEGRKDGTQDGAYQPAETGPLLRARARSGPAAPLHAVLVHQVTSLGILMPRLGVERLQFSTLVYYRYFNFVPM